MVFGSVCYVIVMRDRTRRFTVGPGSDPRTMSILAATPSTRDWAERNTTLLGFILATLTDTLKGSRVITRPRPDSMLPKGVESPATIALRLNDLLRKGFPDETFEVTPVAPSYDTYGSC